MNPGESEAKISHDDLTQDSPEFAAFNSLLNLLITVPPDDIRAKLEDARRPAITSGPEVSNHKESD